MRERDRSREFEEEDRYVPKVGKKAANCPSNRTPVRRTLMYTKHHGIPNPVGKDYSPGLARVPGMLVAP
jgi:hypothetical protein